VLTPFLAPYRDQQAAVHATPQVVHAG
jgi:hypothetical protein